MLRYLRFFGIAVLAIIARPAAAQTFVGSPEGWISVQDYPQDAVAKREEGVVNLSFKIASDGSAQDCKVLYSDASARLRKLSCALIMERATYRPARDETGKPVASEDRLVVRWRLQPTTVVVESQFGGAKPFSSPSGWMTDNDYSAVTQGRGEADIDMRFTIGVDGRIGNCATSQGLTGERSCALLKARARFVQPRGERGEPLATAGHLVMRWRRPR